MPRVYKKLSGVNAQMLQAMGHPPAFYSPQKDRLIDFAAQLNKDRGREDVVSFNTSTSELKDRVYDPSVYEQTEFFTQGDFSGRVVEAYLINDKVIEKVVSVKQKNGMQDPMPNLKFTYEDDKGVLCALSIMQLSGHFFEESTLQPKSRYVITVANNIHAPTQKRAITYISDLDVFNITNFDTKFEDNLKVKSNISEKNILKEIEREIGSKKIYRLISSIFENGEISDTKYSELKNRIDTTNGLDHIDLKLPQVPRILEAAALIDPKIARKIEARLQNSINFYEEQKYERLLSDLLRAAIEQTPENDKAIFMAKELLIEYFVKKNSGNITADQIAPLSTEKIQAIKADLFKTIAPEHQKFFDVAFITSMCNKWHQISCLQDAVLKFKNAILYCEDPHIQAEMRAKLSAFEKLAFQHQNTPFNVKQINIILHALKNIRSFAEEPTSQSKLDNVKKTYQDFKWKMPDFSQEIKIIEQQSIYDSLIDKLRRICIEQPFIKHEIQKKLSSLKYLQLKEYAPKDRDLLIKFVENLINFTEIPSEATYNALFIPGLEIPIFELAPCLQRMPAAHYNYILKHPSKASYFDPQGTVIYDGFEQSGNRAMISRDLQSASEQKAFDKTLLEALTPSNKKQILEAYKKIANKKNILPIQKKLHIYIHRLVNEYYQTLADYNFTEQEREQLINATLRNINDSVIQALAIGLEKAFEKSSLDGNNTIDTDILNKVLHTHFIRLMHEGKTILKDNIKKTYLKKVPSTDFNMNSLNKNSLTLYHLDERTRLSSAIEGEQTELGLEFKHIKTFNINADLEVESEIPRLRLHMAPFELSNEDSLFDESLDQNVNYLIKKFKIKNTITSYLFTGPYTTENLKSDVIKSHLAQAHHFNRANLDAKPLQFVQAIDQSTNGRALGYSFFDWAGIGNEASLMAEMSMTSQIIDDFDFSAYKRFLQPSQSILSTIYRRLFKSNLLNNTYEGTAIKSQIRHLKRQWQQDENIHEMGNDALLKKGLQKLMAFDLHFGHAYASLSQALSLTINPVAFIHDDMNNASLPLNYAQIFDALDHYPAIKKPLELLVKATDKANAEIAASLLNKALMQLNTVQKQNINQMLPFFSQDTDSAENRVDIKSFINNISISERLMATEPSFSRESMLHKKTHKTHHREEKHDISSSNVTKRVHFSSSSDEEKDAYSGNNNPPISRSAMRKK